MDIDERYRTSRDGVVAARDSRGLPFRVTRSARGMGISLFTLVVFGASPALASPLVVNAVMNGAQEVPVHTTTAAGNCNATVDLTTGNVTFSGSFSGLSSPASAATLHGLAAPGVVAPVILAQTTLAVGVSGTFAGGGTLTTSQIGGMLGGQTYCELTDASFPAGEIRGQLTVPMPTPAVPPTAIALLAMVLMTAAIVGIRRRA